MRPKYDPWSTVQRLRARLVREGLTVTQIDGSWWLHLSREQRVDVMWDMVLDAMDVKGDTGFSRQCMARGIGRILRR